MNIYQHVRIIRTATTESNSPPTLREYIQSSTNRRRSSWLSARRRSLRRVARDNYCRSGRSSIAGRLRHSRVGRVEELWRRHQFDCFQLQRLPLASPPHSQSGRPLSQPNRTLRRRCLALLADGRRTSSSSNSNSHSSNKRQTLT